MKKKGKVKFIDSDKSKFYATLQANVDEYFKLNKLSKNANSTMVVKSIILLSSYLIAFAIIIFVQPALWISLLLWFSMGITAAGVGMSVMHDANHGAYSSSKSVNSMMGQSLNLLGGSVFNWKLQHNILHHTYTNVVHMDDDIDDKVVMRFSPHTEVKGYHKFQFLYAFLLYCVLTLYWAVGKDFVQYVKYTANGVNPNNKSENRFTLAGIILNKLFYFFVFLIMPYLVFHIPFLQVMTGFLIMHAVAGLILTIVFQLAHTVEGTSHPLPGLDGNIENNWAIHQMNTTVNFSRNNKWLSWYVGGLNFQVEHHLFPKICHVHYPKLAPIVKATAESFGVPYLENGTFMDALRSHINTLNRFGKVPDINDAIG